MLKSVNFFIFHFQNLNIQALHEPLLSVDLRGTIDKIQEIC